MYSGMGGLYQSGQRFSLAGWSADEWAKFFGAAAPAVSQVYGTIAHTPVATVPTPVVRTPVGNVPEWLVPVGIIAAIGFALTHARPHRNPPRHRGARRRRR